MTLTTPEASLVVNTFEKPSHLSLVLESIARRSTPPISRPERSQV